MIEQTPYSTLFSQHVAIKQQTYSQLMEELGYDKIIIGSGQVNRQFADDMTYPFRVNSYFREWLPLNKRENCYLVIEKGNKPSLYLLDEIDIWHTPAQTLSSDYEACFDLVYYKSLDDVRLAIKSSGNSAYLDSQNTLSVDENCYNPQQVMNYVDYFRQQKNSYEQACIKQANLISVHSHIAAEQAFRTGASELEIKQTFLAKAMCDADDVPYDVIAGINHNAAILHHYRLDAIPPKERNSLLIDAGLCFNCYAADITRTYSYEEGNDFSSLLLEMDVMQQDIANSVKAGVTYADINELTQVKLTQLLIEHDIIKVSADEAMSHSISRSFMPHGFGHGLGVNVHERGADLLSPQGEKCSRNNFGLHKTIVKNEVITVEPGVYFIPSLIQTLKADHPKVANWKKIDALIAYGGIRIEDNILVGDTGPSENYTRQAYVNAS